MQSADAVVLGAGPAGLALASALTAHGLSVITVDRSIGEGPSIQWPNTYGVWRDDLRAVNLGHAAQQASTTTVIRTETEWRSLAKSYTLLDNEVVVATLLDRANDDLLTLRHGTAAFVVQTNETTAADLIDGERIEGRLLFDCRGVDPGDAATHQVAGGIVARLRTPYAPGNATVLMDWAGPARAAGSFCYAIPQPSVGPDVWLIEETILATRTAAPTTPESLRDIARQRIEHSLVEELATEDVMIPLDAHRPNDLRNVGLAFGARAGYVNPISGYSVMTSLRRADRVAEAAAQSIRLPQNIRSGAVSGTIWTATDSRRRRIERAGLNVVADKDQLSCRQFFETFFGLPTNSWFSYLRGDQSPTRMLTTMTTMYRAAPKDLRRQLRSLRDKSA